MQACTIGDSCETFFQSAGVALRRSFSSLLFLFMSLTRSPKPIITQRKAFCSRMCNQRLKGFFDGARCGRSCVSALDGRNAGRRSPAHSHVPTDAVGRRVRVNRYQSVPSFSSFSFFLCFVFLYTKRRDSSASRRCCSAGRQTAGVSGWREDSVGEELFSHGYGKL